jgi:hypothetical protein
MHFSDFVSWVERDRRSTLDRNRSLKVILVGTLRLNGMTVNFRLDVLGRDDILCLTHAAHIRVNGLLQVARRLQRTLLWK